MFVQDEPLGRHFLSPGISGWMLSWRSSKGRAGWQDSGQDFFNDLRVFDTRQFVGIFGITYPRNIVPQRVGMHWFKSRCRLGAELLVCVSTSCCRSRYIKCLRPQSKFCLVGTLSLICVNYESQLSSMAKLLIANEVRIGGLGGGGWKHGQFWGSISQPGRFCTIYVPHDIWVTVGFDPPRPSSDVHLGRLEWRVKWWRNRVKPWKNNGKIEGMEG